MMVDLANLQGVETSEEGTKEEKTKIRGEGECISQLLH